MKKCCPWKGPAKVMCIQDHRMWVDSHCCIGDLGDQVGFLADVASVNPFLNDRINIWPPDIAPVEFLHTGNTGVSFMERLYNLVPESGQNYHSTPSEKAALVG